MLIWEMTSHLCMKYGFLMKYKQFMQIRARMSMNNNNNLLLIINDA